MAQIRAHLRFPVNLGKKLHARYVAAHGVSPFMTPDNPRFPKEVKVRSTQRCVLTYSFRSTAATRIARSTAPRRCSWVRRVARRYQL